VARQQVLVIEASTHTSHSLSPVFALRRRELEGFKSRPSYSVRSAIKVLLLLQQQ